MPLRGVEDMGEELSKEKGFDEVEALGDIQHWLRTDRIPPKDIRRMDGAVDLATGEP